jgi:hypothetical protein
MLNQLPLIAQGLLILDLCGNFQSSRKIAYRSRKKCGELSSGLMSSVFSSF